MSSWVDSIGSAVSNITLPSATTLGFVTVSVATGVYLKRIANNPSHYWVHFLKEDEQALVERLTSRYVVQGPTALVVPPFATVTRRTGITLSSTQYITIRALKVVKGPTIYFLNEREECVGEKKEGINVSPTHYLRIQNIETGEIRIQKGPVLFIPSHNEKVLEHASGLNLGPTDYVRVRNTKTGEIRNVVGPLLFFPNEVDEIREKLTAITLKKFQYVIVLDTRTGQTTVHKGEKMVYLAPTEKQIGDVSDAINVDEDTAVLVRNLETGQLTLTTDKQVFFPANNEKIEEVRKRIRLEDHQVVVVKDENGKYIIKKGTDKERSFFLQPYWELVAVMWSTGIHKDKKALRITHFDCRPQFTWYDFEVRTQDNVELVLGMTFFWQLVDVETMIHTTGDAVGDMCSHARSLVIQATSVKPLEKFLQNFNVIVREAIMNPSDKFYESRGFVIREAEVRSITCKDPTTQRILQEIIQETTNRLSRLQKQESENEVKLRKIQGEIEAEKMNEELLAIRNKHTEESALSEGKCTALSVNAFMEGLKTTLDPKVCVDIYTTIQKKAALETLSKGKSQLFFTPADVNLSIKTDNVPM